MLDAAKIEMAVERSRRGELSRSERGGFLTSQPATSMPSHFEAGAAHAQGIGAIDVAGVHVLPDGGYHLDGLAEVVGQAGDAGGVDGPGRGAAEDGKGLTRRSGNSSATATRTPTW